MKYIRQLDAIRAIAVIFVIVSHWIPKLKLILPWGGIGVDCFFVLSGFLISGILFDSRRTRTELGLSNASILKNFIARRTLRIFPIYYLMVLVHFFVSKELGTDMKDHAAYYFTYTTNVLFYFQGHLEGISSHFWSLAVEEQFYLFWPWIIIFASYKTLPKVMWILVLLGTLFPYLVEGSEMLTPACFNSFALGALLAYGRDSGYVYTRRDILVFNVAMILGVGVMILYPLVDGSVQAQLPMRLSTSLITLRVIFYCLYENDNRLINAVLNNGALVFIGKISYGVYIYHTIIPLLWKTIYNALARAGFDIHSLYLFVPEWLFNDLDLIVKFLLLILLSWLSWTIIERPFNNLKKNFSASKPVVKNQTV